MKAFGNVVWAAGCLMGLGMLMYMFHGCTVGMVEYHRRSPAEFWNNFIPLLVWLASVSLMFTGLYLVRRSKT